MTAGKTNSMRMLEAKGIGYRVHEFSPEIQSAEGVAEALHVPPSQVYKTLVVMRERGRSLLVIVPGDKDLDLKLLAQQIGEKSLHMASRRQAEQITGLQVGGISALALLQRNLDVYADEAILMLATVYVSAGSRGINLSLAPSDLLRVTNAAIVRAT